MKNLKIKIRIEEEVEIEFPYFFKYTDVGLSTYYGKIDDGSVFIIEKVNQTDKQSLYDYSFDIQTFDSTKPGTYFDFKNRSSDVEWKSILEVFNEYSSRF